MQITLPTEVEQFVQRQIESGKYSTPEDVLLAEIRLLEELERTYKGRFEELRREITIGVEEANRGELLDSEAVFQELREKLQKRRTQADS